MADKKNSAPSAPGAATPTTAPTNSPSTSPAPSAPGNDQALSDDIRRLSAEAQLGDQQPSAAEEQLAQGAQDLHALCVKEYDQLFHMVLDPGFAIFTPNWNITPTESKRLCAAYAELCAHYWPDGLQQLGPAIGATLVTFAVIGPRVASGVPRKIEEKKPEPEPAAS